MRRDVKNSIAYIVGSPALKIATMGGGCIGDVYRVELASGETVVAKVGDVGSGLELEGFMLSYLAKNSELPVPNVLHTSAELLLMSYLPGGGGLNPSAQEQAADLVAALHGVTQADFGFERDTVIGGLHQPNPVSRDWVTFFRDQRLLYMGTEAVRAGRLPGRVMHRIDTLAARLGDWIGSPKRASLIHGDMWTGNILSSGSDIIGFVDPAIYYADPEVELAFSTLFGTFSDAFFSRYNEHRPLRPGFFEERRDLYNLYPLLVHVRLFGGGYLNSVDRTLMQFGC